jgi:hypothetical protein
MVYTETQAIARHRHLNECQSPSKEITKDIRRISCGDRSRRNWLATAFIKLYRSLHQTGTLRLVLNFSLNLLDPPNGLLAKSYKSSCIRPASRCCTIIFTCHCLQPLFERWLHLEQPCTSTKVHIYSGHQSCPPESFRMDQHLSSATQLVVQKLHLQSRARCRSSQSSCLNYPQARRRSS